MHGALLYVDKAKAFCGLFVDVLEGAWVPLQIPWRNYRFLTHRTKRHERPRARISTRPRPHPHLRKVNIVPQHYLRLQQVNHLRFGFSTHCQSQIWNWLLFPHWLRKLSCQGKFCLHLFLFLLFVEFGVLIGNADQGTGWEFFSSGCLQR